MRAPELVVHVGLPDTGARQVVQALAHLRPQLRDGGVAYVRAGREDRQAGPVAHARRVADHAGRERRRTGLRRHGAQTVLVGDHDLLGPVQRSDGTGGWWPEARTLLEPLVAALAPVRTTLLLVVRRQDRWLERRCLDDLVAGAPDRLEDWLTGRAGAAPDLEELADRLDGITGVDRVEVLPVEAAGGRPARLVQHVLGTVAVGTDLPVQAPDAWPGRPACTRRGLAVLGALGAELETDDERRLVRRFVLDTFPAAGEVDVLLPEERQEVLASCAAANQRLFRRHQPRADPGAYADDEATARLAALPVLPGRAPARPGVLARTSRGWDRASASVRRAARLVRR